MSEDDLDLTVTVDDAELVPESVDSGTAGPIGTAGEADELAERTKDLQRLSAEFANYRKRQERERLVAKEAGKFAVLTDLLGVLDDLDRAKAHGDLETGPLKSVASKLEGLLDKQGVTAFGAEGDSFDPTLHEAVQQDGDGHNPVIGAVLRKGDRSGDRILRHAMVTVTDAVESVTDDVAHEFE